MILNENIKTMISVVTIFGIILGPSLFALALIGAKKPESHKQKKENQIMVFGSLIIMISIIIIGIGVIITSL